MSFKEQYEAVILRGRDKNASDRDQRIGSAVAQELRECIQPYFLRRLKDEVFHGDDGSNTAKLSKKNEIIVWLKLSNFQRQVYEGILKSEIAQSAFGGSCLVALTVFFVYMNDDSDHDSDDDSDHDSDDDSDHDSDDDSDHDSDDDSDHDSDDASDHDSDDDSDHDSADDSDHDSDDDSDHDSDDDSDHDSDDDSDDNLRSR
ncbi:hypothetical protein Tco_1348565 [Tanacetum coccineum]